MGLILSRFYATKPSTRDTLERIEQDIQNIEERRWDKIKREQFIVQILSFIPITILIATVCILVYPSDSSWRDKLLLCIPIVILNLILWVSRKTVQWYSKWSLDNEETRLRKLHKEKKRILEMVCETESYRVASELLEKYDPKQLRRREHLFQERPSSPSSNTSLTKFTASPNKPTTTTAQPHQQPNQQQQLSAPNQLSFMNQSLSFPVQAPMPVPAAPPPTPLVKRPAQVSNSKPSTHAHNTTITSQHNTSLASPTIATSSVQGRPVRPILAKERTFFEKMVDWVVADGPDNRFALICRYCYGHNGMCLAEEYETINFRCCYCYNLNTATNKRYQLHDQLQPEREKSEQAADSAVGSQRDKTSANKSESERQTSDDTEKNDSHEEGDAVEAKEFNADSARNEKKSSKSENNNQDDRSKHETKDQDTGKKPDDSEIKL